MLSEHLEVSKDEMCSTYMDLQPKFALCLELYRTSK